MTQLFLTCFINNGCNVVDYMLASQEILGTVNTFRTDVNCNLSDHALLEVYLHVDKSATVRLGLG